MSGEQVKPTGALEPASAFGKSEYMSLVRIFEKSVDLAYRRCIVNKGKEQESERED